MKDPKKIELAPNKTLQVCPGCGLSHTRDPEDIKRLCPCCRTPYDGIRGSDQKQDARDYAILRTGGIGRNRHGPNDM